MEAVFGGRDVRSAAPGPQGAAIEPGDGFYAALLAFIADRMAERL
ncbi:MAG: hypothetical protein AAF360_05995 [Pseudomonadota bacterium]